MAEPLWLQALRAFPRMGQSLAASQPLRTVAEEGIDALENGAQDYAWPLRKVSEALSPASRGGRVQFSSAREAAGTREARGDLRAFIPDPTEARPLDQAGFAYSNPTPVTWAPSKLDELRERMALDRQTPEQIIGVPGSTRKWRPLENPEEDQRLLDAHLRAARVMNEWQRTSLRPAMAERAAADLAQARANDAATRHREALQARARAFYDADPRRYPGLGLDGVVGGR